MRDDEAAGSTEQGMEQGAATLASGGGDQPHRPTGEQQRAPGGVARGLLRRFVPLVVLAAIIVATVLHYNRPAPITHSSVDGGGRGAGAGGGSVITFGFDKDAGAPPNPPATTVTPVSNNDASTLTAAATTTSSAISRSSDGPVPSAATGGNVLTSAATELLLKKAPETAAMSERLKQALADKPALNDVVDDGKFFRGKQILPEQECSPKDFEELVHYIEETDCVLVHMAPSRNTLDNPYRMDRQINISHSIVIQGDALNQTFIDCFDAVRCFRVLPGVHLTMRYVGINQGTGEYRDAVPFLEGIPTTPTGLVLESRGGTILFDPGALGGLFVGCMFIDDMSGAEEIELLIELNLNLVSVRIYGGFIFMAGGTLTFINCLFYDFEIMAATDRVYLGGDILILGGTATFTGCMWIYTTVMAGEAGAGFNVALLNGVAVFTFCNFNELNGVIHTDGVGQIFMVVGGVQILTGCSFNYFSAIQMFSGSGEFAVFGGVQVGTGINIFDQMAIMTIFGAGLDWMVGGGVMVHVGVSAQQYSGPINGGLAGGNTFVGGGVYHATAAPTHDSATTSSEFGAGAIVFVGKGVSTHIACPVFDVCGMSLAYFAGEYFFVGDGFLTFLFSPFVVFAGVDHFNGWGGFIFVGLGAAVLGFSPTYQKYFVTDEGKDYWIMGSCEPEPDSWAPQAPFLVTYNYAGPNAERPDGHPSFIACRNRSSSEGERRGLLTPATVLGAMGEGQQKIGFSVFNSSKETVDFGDARMTATLQQLGLPDKVLEMGQILEQAVWPRREEKPQRGPLSLWVNSPVDGYCGVCGVGEVGGPGMASCSYAESCDGFEAPPGMEGLTDFHGIEYKERFIILGSMESTTRSNVSSDPYLAYTASGRRRLNNEDEPMPMWRLLNGDLEEALKTAMLRSLVGLSDGVEDPLQVSVWGTAPDPLFAGLFPPAAPSAAAGGEFGVTHRHDVAIITTSKADADAIIAALQAPPSLPSQDGRKKQRRRRMAQGGGEGGVVGGEGGEVAPGVVQSFEEAADGAVPGGGEGEEEEDAASAKQGEVAEGVKAHMTEEKGIELGHVGLSYKRTLYVPPYNSKAMTRQQPLMDLGPMTVVLTDPDTPSVLATHVEYQKTYRVHLEQFPPHAKLHLQIVGVPETAQGLSALNANGPVFKKTIAGSASGLVGLNALVADEEGRADLDYRFRLQDGPAGDYSLECTDVGTGMSGQSPLFLLSTKRRRRKLYGPIMHV